MTVGLFEMMNLKELEGNCCCLTEVFSRNFQERLRKTTKIVRIAGIRTGIRTENVPNRILNHYRYCNLGIMIK
jgi:hypothetical protein